MMLQRSNKMIEQIKNKYFSDRKEIEKWDKDNKNELETLKKGIYALYHKKRLLYIGMVSGADTASLYARLYGNGNSKHSNKRWFKKTSNVYFYTFTDGEKFDIQILERLLIRELKPQYNDLYFEDTDIQNVLNKM